jgi:hypothetical protein
MVLWKSIIFTDAVTSYQAKKYPSKPGYFSHGVN